jgi:hypothetical protein
MKEWLELAHTDTQDDIMSAFIQFDVCTDDHRVSANVPLSGGNILSCTINIASSEPGKRFCA